MIDPTLDSAHNGAMPSNTLTGMKYKKSYYQKLAHVGYRWAGFWDNHHHFEKGSYTEGGFYDMAVTELDLEDGSWKFMAENGFTRET